MNLKRPANPCIVLLFLAFGCVPAFADTLTFSEGQALPGTTIRTIDGTLIRRDNNVIVWNWRGRILQFTISQVAHIEVAKTGEVWYAPGYGSNGRIQRACDPSDPLIQAMTQTQLNLAAHDFKNSQTERECFLRVGALHGDAEKQLELGRMLLWHNDPKSRAEGVALIKMAADQKVPAAMEQLANLYRHGTVVPADPAKAAQLDAEAEKHMGFSDHMALASEHLQQQSVTVARLAARGCQPSYASMDFYGSLALDEYKQLKTRNPSQAECWLNVAIAKKDKEAIHVKRVRRKNYDEFADVRLAEYRAAASATHLTTSAVRIAALREAELAVNRGDINSSVNSKRKFMHAFLDVADNDSDELDEFAVSKIENAVQDYHSSCFETVSRLGHDEVQPKQRTSFDNDFDETCEVQ